MAHRPSANGAIFYRIDLKTTRTHFLTNLRISLLKSQIKRLIVRPNKSTCVLSTIIHPPHPQTHPHSYTPIHTHAHTYTCACFGLFSCLSVCVGVCVNVSMCKCVYTLGQNFTRCTLIKYTTTVYIIWGLN